MIINAQCYTKDRSRVFYVLSLLNKIRLACVAPHVIETGKQIVQTTNYQVPTKKIKHFNEKP